MDGLCSIAVTEKIKICSRCGETKIINLFNRRSASLDGYTAACKACRSIESEAHRNKNKDKRSEYGKKYRELHYEKLKKYYAEYDKAHADTEFRREQKRLYDINNREKIKVRRRLWDIKNKKINRLKQKARRKQPLIKLRCNLRTLIGNTIKRRGYTKRSKTFEILGCSYQIFKDHIESKFQPGMTWENIGRWHIDHKTPLSIAKDEAELIELFHYTNTQPLWALDNLRKGNKIIYA